MNTCPICGYDQLEHPSFENIDKYTKEELEALQPPYESTLGKASYEECPKCKFEPGQDDNPGTAPGDSFGEYRKGWLKNRHNLSGDQ